MQYAAYIRTNRTGTTGQADLDAQLAAITTWVAAQGGILAEIFSDQATASRSAQRPALDQLKADAGQCRFDALVVYKPDRLARNQTELLAIRSLLIEDYRIRLFSVTEQSELKTR